MSVTDGIAAPPAPARPAPPVKPRPPFRPVAFFLGGRPRRRAPRDPVLLRVSLAAAAWKASRPGRRRCSRSGRGSSRRCSSCASSRIRCFSPARWRPSSWNAPADQPAVTTPQSSSRCILAGAYFYYGVLENLTAPWLAALTGGWVTAYSPTFVAIAAAVAAEMVLGRLAYGKWLNLASAYISGISAGILIKSPELWPFVLCAVISIASKYALRVGGRHLWNPTNFGVTVMLLLASQHTASLSVQYGNVLWVNLLIWTLGALILWKIGKLHIPVTFAAVYLLLSPLRSSLTGNPWVTEVAPLTGPMYQLYICFMITDPKTTTHKVWSQCLTAGLVAVAEAALRLAPTLFSRRRSFCRSTRRTSPCSSSGRPRT